MKISVFKLLIVDMKLLAVKKLGKASHLEEKITFLCLQGDDMVEQYECPNCGAMNSLWPVFSGRRKFYRCEKCGEEYGSKQLDKIWNIEPSKSSISVTPIKEISDKNVLVGQRWQPKGYKTEWEVFHVFEDGTVLLSRDDIPNPGWRAYNRIIPQRTLLKRYIKLR